LWLWEMRPFVQASMVGFHAMPTLGVYQVLRYRPRSVRIDCAVLFHCIIPDADGFSTPTRDGRLCSCSFFVIKNREMGKLPIRHGSPLLIKWIHRAQFSDQHAPNLAIDYQTSKFFTLPRFFPAPTSGVRMRTIWDKQFMIKLALSISFFLICLPQGISKIA
jgi:hypothetical protein